MSVTAYQVPYDANTGNGLVPPIADRRIYELFTSVANGVAEGVQITTSGTQLIIGSGWGMIQGCAFAITAETLQATVPASGTVDGRLTLDLDVSTSTIAFSTEAQTPLSTLTQDDINNGGTVYQLPLATYQISPTAITNLTIAYTSIPSIATIYTNINSALTPIQTKLATIEQGAQVNTVTGIKGGNENSYRTGNVNITKANIGLGLVKNQATTFSLSGTTLTITNSTS